MLGILRLHIARLRHYYIKPILTTHHEHHLNISTHSLSEVGKLELPKVQGQYETGQLFLHRIFGYRGVILFPWLAQVYDRDLPASIAAAAAAAPAPLPTPAPSSQNNTQPGRRDSRVVRGTEATTGSDADDDETSGANEVKGKTNTFYQVLIDSRDCPYIVSI